MEDDNNTASKLIIEKLKKCDDFRDRCDYLMEHDEITYLLDYITNLQQENQELNDSIIWWTNRFNAVQRDYEELKQENERLKELCDKYEEEHSNEFQCWKRDRKELLDKRARIEKVVEYIENAQERDGDEESCSLHVPTLKSILNGRSDE